MSTKEKRRKSDFNPSRGCYLEADGKYYSYEALDANGRIAPVQIEATAEMLEWTIVLDEDDHARDVGDRREDDHADPHFQKSLREYAATGEGLDPWETIAEKIENYEPSELEEKVREIVETSFTPEQKELYYKRFGMCMQFSDIRQEEFEKTGKKPCPSAMTKRKDKMVSKVAKALGAEPPKKRKYKKRE